MSLFQIDAGKEWRGGQRQSFFLAKELKRNGYSFRYVVQPGSPLHEKAAEAGLPVFPLRISGEADALAIVRLALVMKRKKCRLVNFHDAHSVAVGSAAAVRHCAVKKSEGQTSAHAPEEGAPRGIP